MSNELVKEKRSTRIHDKDTKVKKQAKIYKQFVFDSINDKFIKQPHRFSKHHALNCGNPKCIMCSNPRKVFKELTKQEKTLFQEKLYNESEQKLPQREV